MQRSVPESARDKQILKAQFGKKHKVIQRKPLNDRSGYALLLVCLLYIFIQFLWRDFCFRAATSDLPVETTVQAPCNHFNTKVNSPFIP